MASSDLESKKNEVLLKAKQWFKETIVENHKKNINKLKSSKELNINPFLAAYLGALLDGEVTAKSIAKGLIYPRVLGTSINTSFGMNMQTFVTDVLGSTFGSTTSGIDIEFEDQIDKRKKYCQVKLGPNTINADDVVTINGHFSSAKRLGRTNNVKIEIDDLVVAIVYGTEPEISSHYKKLRDEHHYPLFVGKDFWQHLTGDENFYDELVSVIASVAVDINGKEFLEQVIESLADDASIREIAVSINSIEP